MPNVSFVITILPSIGCRVLRTCDRFCQHLLNAADGLSGALFVFYEAESYVAVAVVAEAYSRRHGYFGFGGEELGEFERTEVPIGFGDFGPDEHRRLG